MRYRLRLPTPCDGLGGTRNSERVTIANHLPMPKKRKDDADAKGLWIAEKYSLKGPTGDRAWENRPGGIPSHSRFLELADIALGIKKPHGKKRKSAVSPHSTKKTE